MININIINIINIYDKYDKYVGIYMKFNVVCNVAKFLSFILRKSRLNKIIKHF